MTDRFLEGAAEPSPCLAPRQRVAERRPASHSPNGLYGRAQSSTTAALTEARARRGVVVHAALDAGLSRGRVARLLRSACRAEVPIFGALRSEPTKRVMAARGDKW